jgi:hypothetical protein
LNTDRIAYISSYCDRWCERCAFTSRCSLFEVQAAIGMCGDVKEGIELAVGAPHPEEEHASFSAPPDWVTEFESDEMTPAESADFDRRERECDARLDDTSIMKIAETFSVLAHEWLAASQQSMRTGTDDVLREALEIATHDAFFIGAKLRRALRGRDYHERNDEDEPDPVQNDWNGSAKAALISIERSDAAWLIIAQATGNETAAMLATELSDLRREVEAVFPNAWSFIRPGFDEPWR